MSTIGSRNGYRRLATADPDNEVVILAKTSGGYGSHPESKDAAQKLNNYSRAASKGKRKAPLPPSRPGLFHMFGERGKYAANHVSVALASQSESEQEAERIELTDFRPKKPKFRRGRLKSGGSTGTKSPKAQKAKTKFILIEEPILAGDTVQRVSLRYNCPCSEIRRVNNLYSDQDFFALKTVKIPTREHGILTEPQAREKCRKNNVDDVTQSSGGATSDELRLGGPNAYYRSDDEDYHRSSSVDADDEVGYDSDSPEVRDVSIQSALKWKHSQHALLEKFGEELERVRDSTEQRLANLNEVALTMTSHAIQPILQPKKDSFATNLLVMNWDWRVVMMVGVLICGTLMLCIVGYILLKSKT